MLQQDPPKKRIPVTDEGKVEADCRRKKFHNNNIQIEISNASPQRNQESKKSSQKKEKNERFYVRTQVRGI
jgi:hypothetical protein